MDRLKNISQSHQALEQWIQSQNYRGWDPYDGLNSKVFKSLPFIRNNRLAKLFWIQLFKRSPINLRRLARVEKGVNPKGIALIISSLAKRYPFLNKGTFLI